MRMITRRRMRMSKNDGEQANNGITGGGTPYRAGAGSGSNSGKED